MIRIMTRLAVILLCLVGTAAQAQTAADGRWSDITEVIVKAPRVTEVKVNAPCPAMWRLQRGDSVVWVMPTLTTVTFGMRWDERCLKRRLKGANALLVQSPMVRVAADLVELKKGRLKDVVSPETYARYKAAARRAGEGNGGRYDRYRPGWAATFFLRDAYAKGNLVNQSYPPRMPDVARSVGTPVKEITLFTGGDEGRNTRNLLDAAGDEACLNAVLDRLDHTYDQLPDMIEAWRTADIATVLRLFPAENDSCFPARADGKRIRQENQDRWATVLNAALNTPGKTVVAMPLSWFLYKGGALDQMRRDPNLIITLPEGLEAE
ncbi:TraB/GumN family protein [Asticcacaulis sp. BYS171W]|uniref:TraB/GumN family protein n=1 Tax=Asticcacaulis aquaticus TaxID=2984212 RepID=A0ABT5HTS3_9CAUL|nr:TraB/GumN family protein [Asticcacaulis aquaticus]MDC7683471.1 TraB/GumN family protein [Asticcacaulis aquaticus]